MRSLLRRGYVGLGAVTSAQRLRPDLIVVGGQRCGTTSLFRALEQHPQLVRPTLNKGINYFDINYDRGEQWYAGHFPTARSVRHRTGGDRRAVAFEASGYYLFHPLAPERIARDLPDIKIIAMLRDPVERAFSAWKHERARGYEAEPFDRAIEMESERTRGEADRMRKDPGYQSYAHRHFAYAARGDYPKLLGWYYDLLPAAQIHVVYSEDFFANPAAEFARITRFLDVDHAPGLLFEQHNARRSGPMPPRAQRLLEERFAGQGDQLEALVGRRPPWSNAQLRSTS
ncbi:MAG TPA: sulfotransferase [Jiangellaceae bacterium]|nr:sulfotransferase [Jiangellaceae bacterium]